MRIQNLSKKRHQPRMRGGVAFLICTGKCVLFCTVIGTTIKPPWIHHEIGMAHFRSVVITVVIINLTMGGTKRRSVAKGGKKEAKKAKYYEVGKENEDSLTQKDKENEKESEGTKAASSSRSGEGSVSVEGYTTNSRSTTKNSFESGRTGKTSFSIHAGVAHQIVPVEVACDGDNRSLETSVCCAEWFETCRKKGRLASDSIHDFDLITYVRNELFSKLKFIMDARQLVFSESKDTICYQICRDIKVKESRAASWWEIYKNKIVQTLNNKRADVTAAMKRTFMSK